MLTNSTTKLLAEEKQELEVLKIFYDEGWAEFEKNAGFPPSVFITITEDNEKDLAYAQDIKDFSSFRNHLTTRLKFKHLIKAKLFLREIKHDEPTYNSVIEFMKYPPEFQATVTPPPILEKHLPVPSPAHNFTKCFEDYLVDKSKKHEIARWEENALLQNLYDNKVSSKELNQLVLKLFEFAKTKPEILFFGNIIGSTDKGGNIPVNIGLIIKEKSFSWPDYIFPDSNKAASSLKALGFIADSAHSYHIPYDISLFNYIKNYLPFLIPLDEANADSSRLPNLVEIYKNPIYKTPQEIKASFSHQFWESYMEEALKLRALNGYHYKC